MNESVSRMYVLDLLVQNNKSTLFYGPTGVGKTLEMEQLLFHGLAKSHVPLRFDILKIVLLSAVGCNSH
jgi:Cdc6-like AAA superfamily ATPase